MNLMKLSKPCNPQKSCPPRGRFDHAGKDTSPLSWSSLHWMTKATPPLGH